MANQYTNNENKSSNNRSQGQGNHGNSAQHAEAGRQSHKNDDKRGGSSSR